MSYFHWVRPGGLVADIWTGSDAPNGNYALLTMMDGDGSIIRMETADVAAIVNSGDDPGWVTPAREGTQVFSWKMQDGSVVLVDPEGVRANNHLIVSRDDMKELLPYMT